MSKPCQCDNKSNRNYARYYDTPDGCDVPTKVMVTSRYGILIGVVLSTYDVMMYSHATGLSNILHRYMTHTVPLGLMGATFAVVANTAQHSREKDDAFNYFLGGMACGPILAAYLGSKHAVLLGGLALGVMGVIKKHAVDNCWTLIPDPQPHMNSINGWRRDYTVVCDPKDTMKHTCGVPPKPNVC